MLPVLTQLLKQGDVSFYSLLLVSFSDQIDDIASNDLCEQIVDGATCVQIMVLDMDDGTVLINLIYDGALLINPIYDAAVCIDWRYQIGCFMYRSV